MIEQYKIEKAGNDYAVEQYGVPTITCEVTEFHNGEEGFVAGVEWAESQIKELITKFGKYILSDVFLEEWPHPHFVLVDDKAELEISPENLFMQFLKDRNEN